MEDGPGLCVLSRLLCQILMWTFINAPRDPQPFINLYGGSELEGSVQKQAKGPTHSLGRPSSGPPLAPATEEKTEAVLWLLKAQSSHGQWQG